MNLMLRATLAVAVALASTSQAQAQEIPPLNRGAFEVSMHDRLRDNTVGYAFALTGPVNILAEGADGWAQKPGDGNVRMTVRTPSHIGSVSKLMSGTALLYLLRKKPISNGTVNQQLDAPLSDFLPLKMRQAYSRRLAGVTLRRLLMHKSGLRRAPGDVGYCDGGAPVPNGWINIDYGLSRGAQGPGTNRKYDNCNISVLRFVIPRIAFPDQAASIDQSHADKSGAAYGAAVEPAYRFLFTTFMYTQFFDTVFRGTIPTCNPARDRGPDKFAKYYDSLSDATGGFVEPETCNPQGSFYMSARQLARFARQVGFGNSLVSRGIRKRMIAPDNIDDRLVFNRIISDTTFVAETSKRNWVYHGGSFRGASAVVIKLPGRRYGVAVSNSDEISSGDLAQALFDAYVAATKNAPRRTNG
ncbi:MAG: serine hydrolase domain-containing protein [Pseudomonadota bacterium]